MPATTAERERARRGAGRERGERARQHHALDADVQHARALGDELAHRGERERRREPHRRDDQQQRRGVDHVALDFGSAKLTEKKITSASITCTATDGTAATRCIAPLPRRERGEEERGGQHAERIQAREQRDRDGGEAVARWRGSRTAGR